MDNYSIYKCKDDRLRVYDKRTKKVTSYPRMILEQKIGRRLMPNEQAHHIDKNPFNNDVSNLEIKLLGEHQRLHSKKYYDKEMICPNCGRTFIWSALSQSYYHCNSSRRPNVAGSPFCSRHCSGQYIRNLQLEGKIHGPHKVSRCDEIGST